MTTSIKITSTMFSRWKTRWVRNNMSSRILHLSEQFFAYVITTLLIQAAAGAVIYTRLPIPFQLAGIGMSFLAVINLLVLGIVTARSFDANTIKYKLDEIAANTDPSAVQQFMAALDDFEKKNGLS